MVTASTLLLAAALTLGTDPGVTPGNGASLPASSSRPPGVPGPIPTSSTEVTVGDPAPDFSYKSFDGEWRRLTDLRVHGPILLVFGPDSKELSSIQTERDLLLDLGVVPLAICDVAPHTAYGLVRDLHLGFSVLADPRHVIAEQFNATDGSTQSTIPSWFVVDEKGRVRAMGHGVFPPGYAPLASRALGIPLPGQPRPASTR